MGSSARKVRRQLGVAVLVALLMPGLAMPARSSPQRTHQYVVSGREQAGDLEVFARHVAETLADERGWNLGGAIEFERVLSGGDFTVWLSADSAVSSFGGACSRHYSCRNGGNVVINETRWQTATPAWNASGGSLADYRHMVTNHEIGHWLGLGHASCGGSGQPAPVMQQQSKGLDGCRANPWPLDWERQAVARHQGVAFRAASAGARSDFSSMASVEGGYWILKADGAVFGFGSAPYGGSAHEMASGRARALVGTSTGHGYWIVTSDGSLFGFGDAAARYFGSPRDVGATSGVIGLEATPTDDGYWALKSDGSVLGFGGATYRGSPRDVGFSGRPAQLVATPSGKGYWVAAADGSIFGFGDAADRYFGSPRDHGVLDRVVSMQPTQSAQGYWVATSDGSVFGFGDAAYHGSMHGELESPVSALSGAPEGGYRLLGADGAVFTFGNAGYLGSAS